MRVALLEICRIIMLKVCWIVLAVILSGYATHDRDGRIQHILCFKAPLRHCLPHFFWAEPVLR